jgi:hypothetical protein
MPQPAFPASLDSIITAEAVKFATALRAAAEVAANEQEIRIECERLLAFLEHRAGVTLQGRHEFTVASGRIDSVYERVIIEYKNPRSVRDKIGVKGDSPGTRRVVDQIKSRFHDLQKEYGHPINSLFGVGLDGLHFVFVRFREGKWQVQEPVEVDRVSTERFLWALFNLGQKGRSFSPENLAHDFGSSAGSIARTGIKAFYEAIVATESPKARIFFEQWKILFGEVCGYDMEGSSDKIRLLATTYGIDSASLKSAELLFSVHSYYALFMKLLAAEVVAFFHNLPTPKNRMLTATTGSKLLREMKELESGSIFRHLNITNFLEGDLFAWYLSAWSEGVEKTIRALVEKLDSYNPGTLSEEPSQSRDLLKKLYQQLFPRRVRHDLGEYYTPDWLAEQTLNRVGFDGNPDSRILDPACGSGTFLISAINRIRKWHEEHREDTSLDEGALCRKMLGNVIGFDLNPLAVMAARTNYLIAIRDLIGYVDRVEIPVYLCDAILTPAEYGGLFSGALGTARKLKTAAATFVIPSEIAQTKEQVAQYAETLEFCVRNAFSNDEFLERCQEDGLTITATQLHSDLYRDLVRLDSENKNGVWARIIKNAFAPLFVGEVDFVVGNPPWVNWESLPNDYREALKPLWQKYGLFTLSGSAGRLGGGKKDLSMLFTYVCTDNYLVMNGQLGFVITQSVFKSKGAGDGFRRMKFSFDGRTTHLAPQVIDDISDIQVFDGAVNRTAVFVCRKQEESFRYPVPYMLWRGPSRIDEDTALPAVLGDVSQEMLGAMPVDDLRPTSPWLTAPQDTLPALTKIRGRNHYPAREGANSGGLNGCFWVEKLKDLPGGKVLIENLADVGKIKLEKYQVAVEGDLLFPLLRGRDLTRWQATPSAHILLPQDPEAGKGYPESLLKKSYPLLYAYLKAFEGDVIKPAKGTLRGRALFKLYFKPEDPFYSMYNIGSHTFAPWKVVYKRLSNAMQAAVVDANCVPHEKVILIPTRERIEAHYIAAILNCTGANVLLRSAAVRVQTIEYAPSDVERIQIPQFDPNDALHQKLANLSMLCHQAKVNGDSEELYRLEREIDTCTETLWQLSDGDVNALWTALVSLNPPDANSGAEGVEDD